MWSGRANELWPNKVNLGICSCPEVYIIMDHRAGEMCFNIFKYYEMHFGKNNKLLEKIILE